MRLNSRTYLNHSLHLPKSNTTAARFDSTVLGRNPLQLLHTYIVHFCSASRLSTFIYFSLGFTCEKTNQGLLLLPPYTFPRQLLLKKLTLAKLASTLNLFRPPLCSCTSNLEDESAEKQGFGTTRRKWKDVMRRTKPLPSPPSTVGSRSASSSPCIPTLNRLDSSDSESESTKMMIDSELTRPQTVAIPEGISQHPNVIRKPTLAEILTNTALPPYTLSAFSAYLSHNHCLETLEFSMDASRYRKHYENSTAGGNAIPSSADQEFIKMLWKRLLDAYIVPNGPREVNLPSDVRDRLLYFSEPSSPPLPATLDGAVGKVHELMEDSVLVPFLNSVSMNQLLPDLQSSPAMNDPMSPSPPCLRQQKNLNKRRRRANSPQLGNASKIRPSSSYFSSFTLSRQNTTAKPGNRAGNQRHGAGTTATIMASSYSPGSSDFVLTDDNGSLSSIGAPFDPETPPSTPPLNEFRTGASTGAGNGGRGGTPFGSNKSSRTPSPSLGRDGQAGPGSPNSSSSSPNMNAAWNKLSTKLGWKKRSGGSLRDEGGLI